MAGSGEPSRSASTIVANSTTASGYHILKIDGYSRTLATPTGKYIASLPFTVGGHRWHIRYYPNGYDSEGKDYISLYLIHDSVKPVEAQFEFRFVGEVAEQPLKPGKLSSFRYRSAMGHNIIKREKLERSKHLRDDSFAIRCDLVVVTNELRSEEASDMITVPPSDLPQHLGSLLQTEKGADVVFDVAGETFAAHRYVLAARSPVFSAQFFGAMKESNTARELRPRRCKGGGRGEKVRGGGDGGASEAPVSDDLTGVVRIEDMEPRVFMALLYFIYTDLFPKTEKKTETKAKNMKLVEEADVGDYDEDVLSQHLLVAADRYNLERLKLLCEKKLCQYINAGNVATILALAEQHLCQGLKKQCFHFLSSPANLRAAVASDGFEHLSRSCPSVMAELVAMLGT